MKKIRLFWPKPVQNKLFSYQSKHFTKKETLRFLTNWILEVEKTLLNPVVAKTYTEKYGDYKAFLELLSAGLRFTMNVMMMRLSL